MESHPVASLFPLMGDEEFAALKADIAANGQREPVWLHDGKLIDGRNRYRACTELGLEPKTATWDGKGSLVAFVVSLNLHRRHLSAGLPGADRHADPANAGQRAEADDPPTHRRGVRRDQAR